jgi:hypothetical protein
MARVDLSVQTITRAGLNASFTAATDVNAWAIPNNDGKMFVRVKNSDASPHTVTLDITQSVDGAAVTDPTVSVPAGEERDIGPFPPNIYNQADGRVHLNLDGFTSMTAALLKLG